MSRATRRVGSLVLFTLSAALLPLGSLGCGSNAATNLTVKSLASGQNYEPQFAQAYVARSPQGVDVVLTADGTASDGAVKASDRSTGAAGVRQMMHIRVLWTPGTAVKAENPAATNACIRWFVFADDRSADLIEYAGTGMVTVDPDDDTTTLTVRNASLAPTVRQGSLTDPVGPSKFGGTIVARNSPERVTELLSAMKASVASAKMRQVPAGAQAGAMGP